MFNSLNDDMAEVVRRRVLQAKARVYACFYLLSLPYVLQALVFAKKKKCDVRVILSDDPLNTNTVSYLESHGIPVKVWRQSRGQLHVKLLIVDDTALVGSYNPTFYGSQYNVELMVEVRDRKDVKNLTLFFDRLWRM
jgi:phosphatidylserine/phosphatidylglycerophosphate/cardiolipin synthase-like enzyme